VNATSILPFTSVSLFANTLYVSAASGNNATAIRNDPSHPWIDPNLAVSNAQTGDLIYFVDGSYPSTSIETYKSLNFYFNDGTYLHSLVAIGNCTLNGLGSFDTVTVANNTSDPTFYCKNIYTALSTAYNTNNTITWQIQEKLDGYLHVSGKKNIINCNILTNVLSIVDYNDYNFANWTNMTIEINANFYMSGPRDNLFQIGGGTKIYKFILRCKKMFLNNYGAALLAPISLVDGASLTIKDSDIVATNLNIGFLGTGVNLTPTVTTTNHITMQNCRIQLGSTNQWASRSQYGNGFAYWHFMNVISDVAFVTQGSYSGAVAGTGYLSTNVFGTPLIDTNWFATP
jgi:hypothetical protein